MQPSAIHVFVSSTWIDLRPERHAVEAALQRMRESKFIGMEHFGSQENTTREVSLTEVDRCQLYIGIFGGRYGSGITEAEYRRAREMDLPCFIYIKAATAVEPQFKEADEEKVARLEALIQDLKRDHVVSEFFNPDQLATLVIADLHRWLTDNIYLPIARRAGQSDFPRTQLDALLADVRKLMDLQQDLLRRFPSSDSVVAGGTRSVAIGGGNTGIISTGDIIFQVFTGATPTLSEHIRVTRFRSYIEERTRDFVGRDFIFRRIDNHISDERFRSGYIIIEGEPGIGKSTLAGQLVKLRGYVHHFNIATDNIRSARDFLGNICAQIIVRYKLNHITLPPEAFEDSGFLSQLLTEAAAKTQDLPIVIIVDALDESDHENLPAEANRLFLPRSLPEGVFFIVTTRPKDRRQLLVDSSKTIDIKDESPENLADVRLYVSTYIGHFQDEMASRIADWKIEEAGFIEIITNKSQGNFMYLVHVLRDIHEGKLTADNLDSIYDLPEGLDEYYHRHWDYMRKQDKARFEAYYTPVICILASAQEPVPISQLVEWTRATWPHLDASTIRDVLLVWREFLNEYPPAQGQREPLYHVYHRSFQEFLEVKVGLDNYHDKIAEATMGKIKGFLNREKRH